MYNAKVQYEVGHNENQLKFEKFEFWSYALKYKCFSKIVI